MLPFSRYQIQGSSMLPAFQTGDRILVLRWGSIRAGDTIVFSKNGMTMVKRAVSKNGDRWHVHGDNFSESTDSLDFGDIAKQEIVGKVVAKY